ncbi:MAG: PqqD family protein [Bacteroidales bacterium]
MNFFQRRKILKKVNYLDLTPLRQMEFETREDGKVDILMPRFRHPILKRALQPHWKQEFIRIHLDEMGSAIWHQVDGIINVNEICIRVQAAYPEKLNPPEETEKRVTQFLSLLYQQRYITFLEITREKNRDQANNFLSLGRNQINQL